MREQVLKALNDIYVNYTLLYGKPIKWVTWAFLEDTNITEGGFELSILDKHICLFVDVGTLYIHQNDIVLIYTGGGRVDLDLLDQYTEESHFQESTKNFLAANFDFDDFAEIKKYHELIL
jgi:hypothetical protein